MSIINKILSFLSKRKYTKPDINIDFQVNARGQLVQYFTNPFNACQGKIIDGIEHRGMPIGYSLTFTFLENTYR